MLLFNIQTGLHSHQSSTQNLFTSTHLLDRPSLSWQLLLSFTLHTFTIKLLSQQTIYQTANLPYFITFHFQYIAWLTLSFYIISFITNISHIYLSNISFHINTHNCCSFPIQNLVPCLHTIKFLSMLSL